MLLTLPSSAVAQTSESRFELGAQVAGLRLVGDGRPVLSPGLAPRVHFNLTHRLAIDARVSFFPRQELSLWQAQGGKTLHFAAGVRGKFVTNRRFALYGALLPGVIRFSNAYTLASGDETEPTSHVTFDLGGGVEVYPSPRWIARVDFTRTVYFAPGAEFGRSEPGPTGAVLVASTPVEMVPTWQVSAGVSYRLGPALGPQTEAAASARLSFGFQLAHSTSDEAPFSDITTRQDGSFGGFVSYRVQKYVDVDAAFTTTGDPGRSQITTPYTGGRRSQGLVGVKAGVRGHRVGFFAKFRPGVTSDSKVLHSVERTEGARSETTFRRSTVAAFDFGGVIEWYVVRGLLLRFDAGTVAVFAQVGFHVEWTTHP